MFAMSKLNLSLKLIAFQPLAVVMTRRADRALPGMENGKSQSCNRPALAILLALHFLCMHDSGHTHQVKHRTLRMQ
jgi:hypothetical protein